MTAESALADLFFIALLGAQHGLQPDHAAAAAGLSTRGRTTAIRAAVRISVGHVAALGLGAAVLVHLPNAWMHRFEPVATALAGSALLGLGLALLLQLWRAQYVVHAHAHAHGAKEHEHLHAHPVAATGAHEHRHRAGGLSLGLILGLGGARSLAALLPAMAGPAGGTLGLAAYGIGIAAGVLAVSGLVDVVRAAAAKSESTVRWADLAAGFASVIAGVHLLATM